MSNPHHSTSSAVHTHHAEPNVPTVERLATWLSALCAVHCLVVPVISALVPLLGVSSGSLLGHAADPVLNVLVVVGGSAAAWFGFRRHRHLGVTIAMVAAVLVYMVGHAFDASWIGQALAILGGLSLALASFFSARLGHVHVHDAEHCAH